MVSLYNIITVTKTSPNQSVWRSIIQMPKTMEDVTFKPQSLSTCWLFSEMTHAYTYIILGQGHGTVHSKFGTTHLAQL